MHCYAPMTPYKSFLISKQFSRICIVKSNRCLKVAYISPPIYTNRLNFGKGAISVLSKYANQSHNLIINVDFFDVTVSPL